MKLAGNQRPDPSAGWRSGLALLTAGYLIFESLSGFSIWLLPFSIPNQFLVLVHTAVGMLFGMAATWYLVRHWLHYRTQLLTHIKLLGYFGIFSSAACGLSGAWLTWEALFSIRISYAWDLVHIITTFALVAFTGLHVLLIVARDRKTAELAQAVAAARRYGLGAAALALLFLALAGAGWAAYRPPKLQSDFPPDYSYPYGKDRPFAPSMAVTETGRAFDVRVLSGSLSCGTSGCHEQIVSEWKSSAHRYSAMDVGFQKIQLTMAQQNGPESTRYCGGCHDPISLFSGTKNIFTDPDKLSSLAGYQEGVSCLSCHSVRKTDLKGNAHYVVSEPSRYLFEIEYAENHGFWTRVVRDFLIRAYPRHHVDSLSKRLFKAPEYCAACHKQFIDKEINNVGWVQLQNQYDNWRKSRWNHPNDPRRTIECRECHMPLVDSTDPAAGDTLDFNRSAHDGKHRSHRFVAANQLMPALLKLPGWKKQVELTRHWLRGETEIPEIADRWTRGPAVTVQLVGPQSVAPDSMVHLNTVITSNKVGHDFPTGPLDIIQAWVELTVTDEQGNRIFSSGTVDDKGFIAPGAFIFKAEPVDQYGNLIDRHNLWEMVGVRQRRALFPGFSDTADFSFFCPSTVRKKEGKAPSQEKKSYSLKVPPGAVGMLHVVARLEYRKIDQYLLNFIFGENSGLTSPITEMARDEMVIPIRGKSTD